MLPSHPQPPLIAPSLLAADFARLADEIKDVEACGADWLHVDVMDGHFVPNLTIGPPVVQSIHGAARVPLDVHLMISEPMRYAEAFAQAGAHVLTFHAELAPSAARAREIIRCFRQAGVTKVGAALNPDSAPDLLGDVLEELDLVLVMSVFPGFGGQRFMGEVLPKIAWLRQHGFTGLVEMDGGINASTVAACAQAGCEIFVAGSAVFGAKDRRAALSDLRRLAKGAQLSKTS